MEDGTRCFGEHRGAIEAFGNADVKFSRHFEEDGSVLKATRPLKPQLEVEELIPWTGHLTIPKGYRKSLTMSSKMMMLGVVVPR